MKKLTTLFLALVVLMACAFTMPTRSAQAPQGDVQKQAFADFSMFMNDYENVKNQVARVHQLIVSIENLKAEILGDTERKTALKKLVDLHPDYDLTEIAETITKLSTLKAWLEKNDYIAIDEWEPPELFLSYGVGIGQPEDIYKWVDGQWVLWTKKEKK